MISRAHRSPFSDWWWTVDRGMLSLVLLMLLTGFVLSFAASPPVAERLGLDGLHFVLRHAVYAPMAAALMIGLSFLTPRQVRRAALLLLFVCLALMILVLFVGEEIKGSRRWLFIAGVSVQPSEFIKPAFIVITAWLFAEGSRRPDVPGKMLAVVLLIITSALLVAEPDFGQTILIVAVWGALFFLDRRVDDGGRRARRPWRSPACSAPISPCRTWRAASTASSTRRAATLSRS